MTIGNPINIANNMGKTQEMQSWLNHWEKKGTRGVALWVVAREWFMSLLNCKIMPKKYKAKRLMLPLSLVPSLSQSGFNQS